MQEVAADPLTSSSAAAEEADGSQPSEEVLPPSPELTLAGSRTQFSQQLAATAPAADEINDPVHANHEQQQQQPEESSESADINEIVAASDLKPRRVLRQGELRETKDLFITVDDPFKRVTTMETFVLYRVQSNSTRPEFKDKELHEVRRRYSDFEYLRSQLAAQFPSRVLPPLPDKHSLTSIDRFDPHFIERRAKALQRFLGRIADNPVLSSANVFSLFLTAESQEFDHFRRTHPVSSSGIFSKGNPGQQAAAVSASASTSAAAAQPIELVTDEELADADRDTEALASVFANFEKSSYRLAKELRDLSQEEAELAEALYSLQLAEQSWPSRRSATEDVRLVARAASDCVKLTEELADFVSEEVGQPMHEYMLYARAVKDTAGRMRSLRSEQLAAAEAAERLRNKPAAAKADEQKLQQLEAKAERIADVASSCSADLLADIDRWRAEKRRDTRELLHGLASAHSDNLQAMIQAWTNAQQQQQHETAA